MWDLLVNVRVIIRMAVGVRLEFRYVRYFFTFLLVSLHGMNNYVSVLLVKTQVPYFIVCVVANTAAKGTCKYPHPYLRSAWQARKHFSLNAVSRP